MRYASFMDERKVKAACLLLLAILAGCGPSPDFAPEPETPVKASERPTEEPASNPLTVPCRASTGATRQQARLHRYSGVEGFDSRGCRDLSTPQP